MRNDLFGFLNASAPVFVLISPCLRQPQGPAAGCADTPLDPAKMNKRSDYHGAAHDQHLNCYESTEAAKGPEECTGGAEATNGICSSKLENMVVFQVFPDTFTNEVVKHQQLNNCGLGIPRPLMLLPKIQKKDSPFRNSYRDMLVKGCIKLAGAMRRTAVVCFAPSSSGAVDDDLPSYSQLDKVTHTLRREAFGPLYLVT